MSQDVRVCVPATTPVKDILDPKPCCGGNKCKTAVDKHDPVEALARDLHEAGREAVEKGNTVATSVGKMPTKFTEWDDCNDTVKEGRRIQARWLLARYDIVRKSILKDAKAADFHC